MEERERAELSGYTPRTRTVIQPLSATELASRAAAMAAIAALPADSNFDAPAAASDDRAPAPPLHPTPPPAAPQQPAEPTFILPPRNRISLTFAPAIALEPFVAGAAASSDAASAASAHSPSSAPNEESTVRDVSESSAAELARELNARALDGPAHANDADAKSDADDRAEDESQLARARAIPLPHSPPSSSPTSPSLAAVQAVPPTIALDEADGDGDADAVGAVLAGTASSATAALADEDAPAPSQSPSPSPSPSSSLIGAAGAADDDDDDGNALFGDDDDGDDFLSQIDDLDAAAPIRVVASRPSSARPSALSRAGSFSGGSRPHTAGRERIGSDGRVAESPTSSGHSRQQTGSVFFVGGAGGAGFIIEEHGADSDADSGSDTLEELEHIDFETPHA